MSNAAKNIMIRVIKKRMSNGETFEEVIANYPRLTDEEKLELEQAIEP